MGEHISTRAHCQSSAVAIVPFLAHTHALPRFTCLPVAYSAACCVYSVTWQFQYTPAYISSAMTQPSDRFPLTPSASTAATGLRAKLQTQPLFKPLISVAKLFLPFYRKHILPTSWQIWIHQSVAYSRTNRKTRIMELIGLTIWNLNRSSINGLKLVDRFFEYLRTLYVSSCQVT